MRSLRQPITREKVFNKRKPQSSLSSLPSYTNSRNRNKNKAQSRKSIEKTPEKKTKRPNKSKNLEQKEIEDYDSTDSLDQLLDDTFIPKKRSFSNRLKKPTPKNIASTAGKRRSKAMALMASGCKKDYKSICQQLKYVTSTPKPAMNKNKNKTVSNFTSLRRSRKIITPKPAYIPNHTFNLNLIHNGNDAVTPKKMDATKYLDSPCTPTPVKLFRTLNVKTPQNDTDNNNTDRIKRKLSLRVQDDNKLKSWKDMEHYDENDGNINLCEISLSRLVEKRSILRLPMKLNLLLQKFNGMESTLALYQRKNSFFIPLQNIKHSTQQITKKRFTKKDFQQILNIIPMFYHCQWTPNIDKYTKKKDLKLSVTAIDCDYDEINGDKPEKNKKKNEIGLKFLKVHKLKERENIFRLKLYDYVAKQHEQYLIRNVLVQFDPFVAGSWHKRFDLQNIKDIGINEVLLPCKPMKNMNDIEKMIDVQKEKLDEIVQKELEKAKEEETNETIPKHLRGLSPTFIAKIRAKSKNREINKNNILAKHKDDVYCGDEDKIRYQELGYLVNLVRGIYVSMKRSSMSCNDLVALIKKRHKNQYILNQEIWKQLQCFDELESKFFTIKQGPIVKVAKFNKKVAIKQVFDEINQKIKQ